MVHARDLIQELTFTASRSSGAGGQHVNKVNTKVTLMWDVAHSRLLSDTQRELLIKKLATQLTKDGLLLLTAQDSRSQLQNKEATIAKLDQLLQKAFTVKKSRKPTKPTKASAKKRIDHKKQRGEKKLWRKKI
jgi:ribosome-associated protein